MSAKAEEILKISPLPNEIKYALHYHPENQNNQVVIVTFTNFGSGNSPLHLNVKYLKWEELKPEDEKLLRARHREYQHRMVPEAKGEEERLRGLGNTDEEIEGFYELLPPRLRIYKNAFRAREIGLPPHLVSINGKLDQTLVDHLKEVEKILGVNIESFEPYYGRTDLGKIYDIL